MSRLVIDLARITANARAVVESCRPLGVEIWGVTKALQGCPRVGRAMLQGEVAGLADSRLLNLERLGQALGPLPLMLLRLPSPSRAGATVASAAVSLNSEPATLNLLDLAARQRSLTHQVILMVDLGDRREGVLPAEVEAAGREAARYRALELVGIGSNFACYGAVMPSADNLGELVELAERVRRVTGLELPVVSGGNSTSLRLVEEGSLPQGITQLRVGEAILLGREPSTGRPVAGTGADAFRVQVEVIEVKRRPSLPRGQVARDAFGREPRYQDRGERLRALGAIGVQDLGAGSIAPEAPGIEVLGASSDHLILDVTETGSPVQVGDHLWFRPDYGALLALATCPHVERHYVGDQDARRTMM
ncbi:MAG TPA: alanine racemase [Clostridiales bacterium]|nr:alanine racemase [Clostridiales bacterium]